MRFSDRVRKKGNEFVVSVVFGKGMGEEEEETVEGKEEGAAEEGSDKTKTEKAKKE